MMRNILLGIFVISLFLGCKDPTLIPIDLCKGCECGFKINGLQTDWKPYSAWLRTYSSSIDTIFGMSIREKIPFGDIFSDALVFTNIPYKTGKYELDSVQLSLWHGLDAYFMVYKTENSTHTQMYYLIPDSNNYVEVEFLDKIAQKFRISFHLTLRIHDAKLYQSAYPESITISDGWVEGYIY